MKYEGNLGNAEVASLSESGIFGVEQGGKTVVVPDAHLLFSGDFQRSGHSLIISDASHRFVVTDYFAGGKRPSLVSPEGAPFDPSVVDALTGYVQVAQADATAAGKVIGQVVKMTGSASVVRNGVTIVMNVGDVVYQNDVIQTGSNSTLGLVLADGSAFNLSANARMMLNDLTYDPSGSSNSGLITLVQGAASFVAGQVAKTGDMKVTTPVATLGIRGTVVTLEVSATDGKVSISVVDQKDGLVHTVQVYDRVGPNAVLIGTVSSDSPHSLTISPTATFAIVAEVPKTPAQAQAEAAILTGVLQTYDAGKQINPNLPQHSEKQQQQGPTGADKPGEKAADAGGASGDKTADASPATTAAKAVSSASPSSPETQVKEPVAQTTVVALDANKPVTVAVVTPSTATAASANSQTTTTSTDALFVAPTPAPPASIGSVSNAKTTTIADHGFSTDKTLTLTGVTDGGSTVKIYDTDGSTVVGSAVASGNSFSITTSVLGEGDHTLTAQAFDAAGKPGPVSSAFHVTIDTVAPNAPSITSLSDDVFPFTGIVGNGGSTNDTDLTVRVSLSGTNAVAGDTVWLYDGIGTAHQLGASYTLSATDIANGFVDVQTGTLTNGSTYTFTTRIIDQAGNESAASASFVVTENGTAPNRPSISSVTDDVSPLTGSLNSGGSTNDANLTVRVSLSGTNAVAGDNIELYNGNGAGSQLGLSYTLTSTDIINDFADVQTGTLSDGITYAIAARVTDQAGNHSDASSPFIVTVDMTVNAPSVTSVTDDISPLIGPINDNGFSNDTRLTIFGAAETGSTVTIYDTDGTTELGNAVAVGGNYLITTSALSEGSHTLTAKATDLTGNQSSFSSAFHVTIDTASPVAPLIASVTDDMAPFTGPLTNGGSTNDSDLTVRVSLSGTNAVAGDSIQLYNGTGTDSQLGSSYTLTVTDISNGFADVQTGTLNDGATYSVTARVVDQAGNESDASGEFTFSTAPSAPKIDSVTDDVSPFTGPIADNGSSNDTTLTLAGTAEAGSTVTIYDTDGTTVLGSGLATGGSYSITTSALGEGSHTLTAKATDAAGNQGVASTAFHVLIDTAAPSAPSIASVTDDVAPFTGPIADNGSSNDTTLTLAGTAEAGSTVTIYDTDGTTVLGSGLATGGSYSITTSALGEGSHTLTAKATDAAGNQGVASTAFHVLIDTAAPSAPSIASVTDNVAPFTGPLTSGGSTNDSDLTVRVSLSGTNAVAGDSIQLYNGTGTGSQLGSSYTLTASDISNGFADVQTGTLNNGTTYTITGRVTDQAGNQSAASGSFVVTEAGTAPSAPSIASVTDNVAPFTGPLTSGGSTNDSDLTVRVSLSGTNAVAGDSIQLYNGTGTGSQLGSSYTLTASDISNGFADVQTGTLNNGTTYTITGRVTDQAGNQSAASGSFVVTEDTAAPAAPSIASVTDNVAPFTGPIADNGSSNDTTLTLAGTAEAGSTVTIYDTDGTTVLGSGLATGGSYSITTSALGEGSHTLTAKATDAAGNQGVASTAFHVLIDTAAPSAPSIASVTDNVAPFTGPLTSGGSTNDSDLTVRVSLSGTNAVAGDSIQLYNGTGTGSQLGSSYTLTASDISNGFADVQTGTLNNGTTYTITGRVTDQAGNQSAASGSFVVTEDTAAPAAPSIASVTDNVAPFTGPLTSGGSTNDSDLTVRVSLSGTNAVAGDSIQLYNGTGTGSQLGSSYTLTASDISNGFADVQTGTLNNGTTYTITGRVTDQAGNQSAASGSFVVTEAGTAPSAPSIASVTDNVAPFTGPLTSGGSTNDSDLTVRVSLSGTNAVAGDSIQLYNGTGTGSQLGSSYTLTASDISNGFADVQTGTLNNGTTYTITGRVTDQAGNQSAASGSFVVTEDTAAPAAPSIASVTDNVAPFTGPLTSGGSTNDSDLTVRVSLSGTNAVAGDSIQLYNGTGTGSQLGSSYTLTASDISNGFADVQTGTLNNGTTYTITGRVTDQAGNQSAASGSFVVTEDTAAPAAPSIASVTDNVAPFTGPLTSGGSTNDSDLTVRVSLSGTNAVAGDSIQLYNGTGTGSQLGSSYTLTASDISNGFADVQTGTLNNGTTYTITGRVTDQAGNQSAASGSFVVTEAGTAPSAPSIASVTDNVAPFTGPLTSGGSTNDSDLTVRVSLSGTNAVAGDSIQLYNGTGTGSQLGSSYTLTASDISNGFADVQTGTLNNGTTYTITGRVTDQAGNQSAASGSFVVTEDTAAPAAPSIASVTDNVAPFTGPLTSGGSTNDSDLTVRVSLSGTNAVAGDSIQLYNGTGTGSQLGSSYTLTASDISNGFADVQTGTLNNGTTNTITGRVTDQAGNQSAASGSFVVTEDTAAPAAPSIASVTDNVAPFTGPLTSGGSTNDSDLTVRVSLSGTNAVAGDSIQLYNGTGTGSQLGSSYTLTASDISNGFADVQTGTLNNGTTYTITGRVTDQAGNQSAASGSFVVTEDTAAPAAPSIASVTDNVAPFTGPLTSGGSTNDSDLTVRVSLSGTNAVAGDSIQLYNGTGTGSQLGSSYTLTASDISNGFADVQTGTLNNGTTYTITGRVTDQAGNQSAASGSFVVTEDTAAPAAPSIASVTDNVAPFTGPIADNGSSNDTTLTLAGTAEAGSTVTIYDTDGTTVLGSGLATGGSYSITTSALGEGSHTLTAKATDAAGNQGVASTAFHVLIDTAAPSAPSIASVTDNVAPFTGPLTSGGSTNDSDLTVRVSLSGTNAVAGDSIQLYNGTGTGSQLGSSYTLTASDISNGFADVQTGTLNNGTTYTITGRVTDQAGNQSAASGSFVVTEDTAAPAAPSIASVTDNVAPFTGPLTSGGSTNDSDLTVRVSLSGTNAVAGDSIQLYNGTGTGSQLGSSYTLTASDISNGFADVQTGTLNNGTTYTITGRVTDQAGNQSAASGSFVVTEAGTAPSAPSIASVTDNVAPFTGPLTSGGSTNDSDLTVRVSLSGTNAVAGDSIQLYNGTGTGSQLGSSYTLTASDISNGFADVQTGTLNNGTTYTITGRVTDQAGNQSAASGSFVVTEAGTAPSAPSIASVTDNVAPFTGPLTSGGSTNDSDLTVRVSLSGTNAVAGDSIQLYNGTGTGSQLGSSYTLTASDISNGFADVQTGTLNNGTTYTITGRVTDQAGNQSAASGSFVVTEDTAAPAAPSIASVTDNVAPFTGPLTSGGSTNDSDLTVRVSLSGTNAVAGDSIQLYNGTGTGSQLGSSYTLTASDISNGFADVQTGTLNNGTTYTITGRVTDQAGNQSAASGSFVVTEDTAAPAAPSIASVTDNVAPFTGPIADNGSSNDTTLTLAGTAEAGSTVTIYDTDGTTVLGSGLATGGSYSITTSALGEGSHTLTAKATDAAGNQGVASTAFHVLIDTAAPSAPSIASVTDNVAPFTGPLTSGGSTNDSDLTVRVSLSGTNAVAGDSIQLYNGTGTGSQLGSSYTLTASDISNGFADVQTGTLNNGTTYTITGRVTDQAGNQSAASGSFVVTEDTAAPAAPSIASVTDNVAPFTGPLTSGGSTNDSDLTVRVSLSGTNAVAGDSIQLYNGTGTGSQLGSSYTLTASDISNGFADVQTGTLNNGTTYTITGRVTDQAGNQSAASGSFVVTEDTAAPAAPSIASVTDDVAPFTGPIADNGSSNDTTLTLAGTAEAGSTVTIYDTDGTTVLGSGLATGGSYSITTSALGEGSHTLTAKATDAAGNQGVASTAFHVGIDSVSPTDIILSNSSVAENSPVGTVVGSFSDVDPGATGIASFALLDDAAGRFAITSGNLVVVGSLDYETAQSHQITVRVTDSAGNIFDKVLTVIVTDVAGVTLNGDAGANVLVGTPEADTLNGLGGNDRLQGLGGNDWLDGGAGFDRAVYSDATGPVTVNLAAGTAFGAGVGSDTLVSIEGAVGGDFADTFDATGFTGWSTQPGVALGQSAFEGRGGDDVITGRINDLGQSLTRVEYLSASAAVTVDLAARTGQGTAAGDVANVGNDTFTNALQGVFGSAYSDTIYGSNNPTFTYEVFEGRGGDDYIDGRGGYDMAAYNNDPATTTGITVNLAAGTVIGDSTIGTDTLRDVEAVRGTNFNDVFDATGYGVAGALNVSSTNGTFNDFAGAGGNDTITGNGNTRLNYSIAQAAVTVDLQITTGTAVTVAGTATGTTEGTDTFTGVNAVQASVFADTLLGSNYNNTFTGLGGDDFIDGRGGFDTASYNNLNTVTGGVAVNMAAGTVTGDASTGTDTLRNIEAIQGTGYADSYDATGYGASGALNVSTSNGSFNQFEGLGGDDSVTGNGNTRVVYSNATGPVTITIGAGGAGSALGDASTGHDTFTGGVNSAIGSSSADSYDASGFNGGFNSFQGNGGNDTITGNGSTQVQYGNATSSVTITIGAGGTGSASGDSSVGSDTFVSGVNSAIGGNSNDTYNASAFGAGLYNSFQGNGGNDTITGNGSTQVQYGNATSSVTITIGAGGTGSASGDSSVGSDTFVSGVNSAIGGNSNDTYNASAFGAGLYNSFQGNGGNDTITGNGNTQVQYYNATSSVTITLTAGGAGSASGDSSVGSDTFVSGVNGAIGSNKADTYNASAFGAGLYNSFQGNGGNDTITGNGNTQVQYYNATSGVTITIGAGGAGSASGDSSVGTDSFTGVYGAAGSNFNDTYNASAFSPGQFNSFLGNGGNDTITGNGSTQIEYFTATAGVNVNLTTGIASGNASVGTDTITGGVSGVQGSNFGDTIIGSLVSDSLFGNGGNDTLFGAGGNDYLVGGSGADTFVYAANGTAYIADFNRSEGDRIMTGVTGIATLADIQARATQQGSDTLIDFGGGNTITLANVTVGSLVASDFVFGVTGTSANDVLTGTSQTDGLFGLGGNDRLQGLGGNDWLDGGNGFDRAVYTDATGPVTVNLAAGTASGAGVGSDTLISIEAAVGSDFADTFDATGFTGWSTQPGVALGQSAFEGRGGDDVITGRINDLGQSLTRVEYLSASAAVTVDLAARTGHGTAAGDAAHVGNDTFTNALQGLFGSAYNDTIYGSNNAAFTYEVFEGRGGDDYIDGRGGYDMVAYNNDPTTTSGITVNLAAGTVTGDGSVGTDTLRDVEAVRGTNFDDLFDATGYGVAGALNVSSTNGTFNDFSGAGGNDTITGNGNTRLNYSGAQAAVTVDLQITTGTAVTVAGTATGTTEGTDTFTGVNAVQASVFADTLLGSNYNNTFTGLGGDDFIDGRGGFDTASYNNLNTVTGGVAVNMAAGTVTGDASTGTDTLRNIEAIQGTGYADSYDATGYGASGALNVSTSNGSFNQFEGLGGDDSVTGNGNTRVVYSNATGPVTITIGAGGAGSALGDASTGHDTFTGGVNSAIGSSSADSYDASGFNGGFNSFQGNGGNDTITGNGSTQVQYGNATSSVTITIGAGGTGSASGDSSVGSDTFVSGVNSAIGGNSNDTYNASAFGAGLYNSFQGNGGNDTIIGNGSTQVLYNNATAGVTVNLSSGIATGDDSVGTDTITGGVNSVSGSNFIDMLIGSSSNDILLGNGGNDTLAGGGGNDTLTGGAGNDNFVFTSGSAAGATITDFSGNGASAGDTLEFHGFGLATDGATLTWLSGNQWQIHSGLNGHNEVITLNGTTSTSVHPTDYQFLL